MKIILASLILLLMIPGHGQASVGQSSYNQASYDASDFYQEKYIISDRDHFLRIMNMMP